MDQWRKLGEVLPDSLVGIRLQMHYAAMLAVAPSHTLLPHREDYSEDALTWLSDSHALRAEPVEGLTCLLSLKTGELLVSSEEGTPERFQLHGLSVAEARRRLAEILSRRLQRTVALRLPIEDYGEEMPEHELRSGEPFQWEEAPAQELCRYYDNAAWSIQEATANEKGASPLRVWPHHFDMAVLVTYGEVEPKRFIGVGYSPGDTSYPSGYFYVNPWPAPKPDAALPELPGGAAWHKQGWVGAVLSTQTLIGATDQKSALARYQEAAIRAEKKLLDIR